MRRARLVFTTISLMIVLLATSLLLASRSEQDELFRSLGILAEVVHLVHQEYVDPLDTEALELSLEAGIVQAIDPWAAVLPADQVDSYLDMLRSPPPYGFGLATRFSSAAVRHTLNGSPARESGLETWEVVEMVEGVNTRGQPLWQVKLELAQRLRQQQPVKLTIVDRFGDERREVVLEPAQWQPQVVKSEEHDGVTVLNVQCLPAGGAAVIEAAVPSGEPFIIDLRELVWGLEEEAIAVADLFAREGALGIWRGRRAGEQAFTASPEVVTETPPLVLIGPNTEGVGEILAGGLQRAGATLVGNRTVGHAPHMDLVNDGELHLWIPVARWLRPDDKPIFRDGIEPDTSVELADAEEGEDPVLLKALELLRERHGQQAAA